MTNEAHISVLHDEAIEALAIADNGIYIDGTFGAGGHSRSILQTANCKLFGVDRDPNVKPYADALKTDYPDRFEFIEGCFADISELCDAKIDGFLLDIGVSSMQLDEGERGFSFSKEAPLDMRMSQTGLSAYDIVNTTPEAELANIIYKFGDERKSRRIANAIIEHRPIETTTQLAEIIRKAVGKYNDTIHPATRSFQAIRIAVNDELGQLEQGLLAASKMLNKGGRLAVITFHSGEDKIVKSFFKKLTGKDKKSISRHVVVMQSDDTTQAEFKNITRKPIVANDVEVKTNPRARSAKLRVVEKL